MRGNPFNLSVDGDINEMFLVTMVSLEGIKHIVAKGTEDKALDYIMQLGKNDPRKVDSIRSIDTNGKVTEYEIIFDGRIVLQEKEEPEEEERLTRDEWAQRYNMGRPFDLVANNDGNVYMTGTLSPHSPKKDELVAADCPVYDTK